MKFQMFTLVLGKAEEPENKSPTSAGSSKKQEFQKNIDFCFVAWDFFGRNDAKAETPVLWIPHAKN